MSVNVVTPYGVVPTEGDAVCATGSALPFLSTVMASLAVSKS